ncbi:MAG: hypothetical protein A2Y10_18015 [Planctomycetes bacterium GWF2_41_51]|nr:MAG: hypothetical protein A2Y10_18015 [Planctomycetes bacterium GWF2_41_51]
MKAEQLIMLEHFLKTTSNAVRKCVVCSEPLGKNHKCSKEGEARFNHNLSNRQYKQISIRRQRYGQGLTFDQKLYDAFNVFNNEPIDDCSNADTL